MGKIRTRRIGRARSWFRISTENDFSSSRNSGYEPVNGLELRRGVIQIQYIIERWPPPVGVGCACSENTKPPINYYYRTDWRTDRCRAVTFSHSNAGATASIINFGTRRVCKTSRHETVRRTVRLRVHLVMDLARGQRDERWRSVKPRAVNGFSRLCKIGGGLKIPRPRESYVFATPSLRFDVLWSVIVPFGFLDPEWNEEFKSVIQQLMLFFLICKRIITFSVSNSGLKVSSGNRTRQLVLFKRRFSLFSMVFPIVYGKTTLKLSKNG